MMCPKCSSNKYKKNGHRNGLQRYKCNECYKEWSDSRGQEPLSNVNTSSSTEELNYKYITDNVVCKKAPTLESLLKKFNFLFGVFTLNFNGDTFAPCTVGKSQTTGIFLTKVALA